MIIRIQLIVPENDFISAGFFNQMITRHGTTMIFLAGMSILVGLMNVAMSLLIGARDVSFPFLNALCFWLFLFGGILLNLTFLLGGAPDAGWTSYASLAMESSVHGVDFYIAGQIGRASCRE